VTVKMKLGFRPSLLNEMCSTQMSAFFSFCVLKDFNRSLYLLHFLSQIQCAEDYLLAGYKCGRV
jgi:hypothetical protein